MRLSRRALLWSPTMLASAWARPAAASPLWHGARHTQDDKAQAIRRGLAFIAQTAKDRKNFADYSSDYLWCFYTIGTVATDRDLAARAHTLAQERATEWRRLNPGVPDNAGADDIADLVYGQYSADLIGVPDPAMKRELRRAASRFTPREFLRFDPANEAIPQDLPDRYGVLTDAVIATYIGERYGVLLGGRLADVLKWVPAMRPYPKFKSVADDGFIELTNAITHIVYALNDYTQSRLRPEWLPQEYQFLIAHLTQVIANRGAETVGEFLDTLISFGLNTEHPLLRAGIEYLLAAQNPDGSWGDANDGDVYNRYHPTWTAMNGLMDYAFARGEAPSFPDALRVVQGLPG